MSWEPSSQTPPTNRTVPGGCTIRRRGNRHNKPEQIAYAPHEPNRLRIIGIAFLISVLAGSPPS